jgi:DNA-binding MarR family transcriptional regulator
MAMAEKSARRRPASTRSDGRPRPAPASAATPARRPLDEPDGLSAVDSRAADLPLAHQLSRALFALHSSRVGDAQKLMDEFGLSPTQMRLLVLMDPHGESTMSQAAQAAFCEPSNLTGVVDKLEARGLVKRSLLTTDRRVKIISMTRAGRTVRARLFARMYEPAPWMLALSERDQQDMLAILRKGLAYLESIATPTLKE